jgi:prepilin-type N-terminal cleavage/methylation domain-containing protein/prepilin-type processing-associated H-X9-DG protein
MKMRGLMQVIQPRCKSDAAFTLVELLVTIAIIGILAGLILAALAKAKAHASGMTCLNNLNQLGKAFVLYHGDFADTFPAPGSRATYGPQPEDWIWWQYGRDASKSAIAPYVAKFNPRLFTCNLDNDALRLQGLDLVPGDPYRYSYALTSYPVRDEINPGMSTIITQQRKVYPFKATSISRPAQKIMLVEEERSTIDDPRWVPVGPKTNLVATRHDGKGYVTFGDGHNELVTPLFGMNPANNNPIN